MHTPQAARMRAHDPVPSDRLKEVRASDVHLVFALRRSLIPDPEASVDARHDWSVEILASRPGDDDLVRIGSASAESYALDGDTRNAADELSNDAVCCVDALLDEDGEVREDLELAEMGSRILHVDRIWLDPAVRGRGLGLLVLRTCVDTLALDCACVIVHPTPTEPLDMPASVREEARLRLHAYWQRADFHPVPRDDIHLYLDPGLQQTRWPLPSDAPHAIGVAATEPGTRGGAA